MLVVWDSGFDSLSMLFCFLNIRASHHRLTFKITSFWSRSTWSPCLRFLFLSITHPSRLFSFWQPWGYLSETFICWAGEVSLIFLSGSKCWELSPLEAVPGRAVFLPLLTLLLQPRSFTYASSYLSVWQVSNPPWEFSIWLEYKNRWIKLH